MEAICAAALYLAVALDGDHRVAVSEPLSATFVVARFDLEWGKHTRLIVRRAEWDDELRRWQWRERRR